jgi:hypothetical protein
MYITVQQLTKRVREPEDDHLGRNMSFYKNLINVKKCVKSEKGLSTGSTTTHWDAALQTEQEGRFSANLFLFTDISHLLLLPYLSSVKDDA